MTNFHDSSDNTSRESESGDKGARLDATDLGDVTVTGSPSLFDTIPGLRSLVDDAVKVTSDPGLAVVVQAQDRIIAHVVQVPRPDHSD